MKEKKDILSRFLALLGVILVWLPLLAPILFGLVSLVSHGVFRLDYLMPAELFPLTIAGGGMLVWAAVRARSHARWIGWSLGLAAGLLVAVQAVSEVSGLASGKTEPGGFWWAVVMAGFALFVLADLFLAVGGTSLLRNFFRGTPKPV